MGRFALLLSVVICASGCGSGNSASEYAEVTAAGLFELSLALKELYGAEGTPESAIVKLEHIVIRDVLLLRATGLKVDELRAPAVKGLCEVMALTQTAKWGQALADNEMIELTNGYLETLDPGLSARAAKLRQTVLVGDACDT